ncbi:MAG: phosphoadenylyl-sulfate reductase [Rhodocyclales bacterium]|nr:phosphoadenylyl-sulfate reductase [Rhodocyclales bacterium]
MLRENIPDLADLELVAAVAEKAVRAKQLLRDVARDYAPVVFANSLGAEDMVLTDMIWSERLAIGIFSLDTGRLPAETYELIARAEAHYQRRIEIYAPRHDAVQDCIGAHGINGFYDSVAARKACCQARKIEPLQRALAGKQAWITGLRSAQSPTRDKLKPVAFDHANGLVKISPLADWSEREVWVYLRANKVPYNALHDRNFPSIGCAPCTRAVQAGEDVRAGRWWWETPETKECGLHLVDGKLQRVAKPEVGADGTAAA